MVMKRHTATAAKTTTQVFHGLKSFYSLDLVDRKMMLVRGLVKFVPAVVYHIFLNLPATFSQPCTIMILGPA